MARTKQIGHRSKGSKQHSSGALDLSSARGCAVVLATSDGARGKEATKELLNLLQEAFEVLYPHLNTSYSNTSMQQQHQDDDDEEECDKEEKVNDHNEYHQGEKSLEELLKQEINQVKASRRTGERVFSAINTDTKGLVLVIIHKEEVCAKSLVTEIFNQVSRTKAACSRHLVRVIPLQRTCYPSEDELKVTMEVLIQNEFRIEKAEDPEKVKETDEKGSSAVADVADRISESREGGEGEEGKGEPVAKKHRIAERMRTYCVDFKTRSHDVLKRADVFPIVNACMPDFCSVNYRTPEVNTCITFTSIYVRIYLYK